MRDDFAEGLFAVGLSAENRDASGPHDDPHRNQIDAGKHETHGTIDAFCDRIAEEAGIGYENSVGEAFFLVLTDVFVGIFGVQHTESFGADRDQKYSYAVAERAARQVLHKGCDDIAGQHDIDDQIGDVFLAFPADHALLADPKADADQREYDELKPEHSNHGFFSFLYRGGQSVTINPHDHRPPWIL